MTFLQPMPVISRDVPAYTNDDFSTSFPASRANDSTYHDPFTWRCATTPIGNANSGTLTQPVYLAYDLSGVPSSQRRQVVLVWYFDGPGIGPYDPGLIGQIYGNQANAYTIDVNAAAGGSLPSSGWITKVTVTGSTYHSRQHSFDMTGYNWVRINVTAAIGNVGNNNVAMNMDVHDAHNGVTDDWIFYGDSISQRALDHDDGAAGQAMGSIAPAQINAVRGAYFPLWENGSVGGYTATDMQAIMASTFLPLFPGQYVALPLGSNDANGGGTSTFQAKMQSMITSILGAGKIPVIPHIPYGLTANIIANGPTINGYIDTLIASNPGCIAGPDLWTYFFNNQSLISGDQIHMTDPAGMAAYRVQWVNWATANIYFKILQASSRTNYKVRTILNSPSHTNYKVRTILKTQVRTSFKVQLSGVTPKPYFINGVVTTPFARPFSTVTSTATVVNQSDVTQDGLTATCTVTYPDNSTQAEQVYALGSGQYEVIYQTKGVGTVTELWTCTGSVGSQAEYQHQFPVYFES